MLRQNENIQIDQAKPENLSWINQRYKEINFCASNYENEIIVIASINGIRAGLGRLVNIDPNSVELGGIYVIPEYRNLKIAQKIVSYLVTEIEPNKDCYCLPFENLSNFYKSFGFVEAGAKVVPVEVQEKHQWCLNNYDTNTLLLVLPSQLGLT